METRSLKRRFLEENTNYKEIKPSHDAVTTGEFQDIDEIEEEIWLLQCPKGFDIEKELQGQKLKIPGRTNLTTAEFVAAEFDEPAIRAFGYCNRKGRYALRLLPIKGNVLLRGRLKATDAVTLESAVALYPPQQRIPLPDMIKVRHPLHGHQFDKNIRVGKAIQDRLRRADEVSAKLLMEAIKTKNQKNSKELTTPLQKTQQTIKSGMTTNDKNEDGDDDDNDVTFVSELKVKKSRKRKNSESGIAEPKINTSSTDEVILKKNRKSYQANNGEDIAEDLQWIQNL